MESWLCTVHNPTFWILARLASCALCVELLSAASPASTSSEYCPWCLCIGMARSAGLYQLGRLGSQSHHRRHPSRSCTLRPSPSDSSLCAGSRWPCLSLFSWSSCTCQAQYSHYRGCRSLRAFGFYGLCPAPPTQCHLGAGRLLVRFDRRRAHRSFCGPGGDLQTATASPPCARKAWCLLGGTSPSAALIFCRRSRCREPLNALSPA